jgi:hypothetical protein
MTKPTDNEDIQDQIKAEEITEQPVISSIPPDIEKRMFLLLC